MERQLSPQALGTFEIILSSCDIILEANAFYVEKIKAGLAVYF